MTAPHDTDTPEADTPASAGRVDDDLPAALAAKLADAESVVADALADFDRPVVPWTGGKDSTLVLHLVRRVAADRGEPTPPVAFVDHGAHFDETRAFVDRWADEWDLDLHVARLEELTAHEPGTELRVAELSERVRTELDRVGHEGDTLVVDADSMAGNHLLKTVAFNDLLRAEGFDAALTGVRSDESDARADETVRSPRGDEHTPDHVRVHPILDFSEADVWTALWGVVVPETVPGFPVGAVPRSASDLPAGVSAEDLPISPKYWEGYRSLGTAAGSARTVDEPAWLQSLGDGGERAGRAQEKEDLMAHLRDLGYM
ncbi:phosphoadenosine phosphosulfate reductase family protein [Halobaculum lipolyticum]|uniref:Phosphoadenosine phosphosulfate reductase family protein n=1 Tax=Halobaculum lipolyticum TaxID=3032001 RepID=A0ABD5W9Q3_9EURY|nr:phosphoadenosine phosphosulfate reductase family protein [Halobaculum sp. DT31]